MASLPINALLLIVSVAPKVASMPPPSPRPPVSAVPKPPWATLADSVLLVTVSVPPSIAIPPPTPTPVKALAMMAPLPPMAWLPVSAQLVKDRDPAISMMAPPIPTSANAEEAVAPLPPMAWLPVNVQFVRVTVVLAVSNRIAPARPWLPPSPNEPLNAPPMDWLLAKELLLKVRVQPSALMAPPLLMLPAPPVADVAGEAGVADCRDHANSRSIAPPSPKTEPLPPIAWLPVNVQLDTLSVELYGWLGGNP